MLATTNKMKSNHKLSFLAEPTKPVNIHDAANTCDEIRSHITYHLDLNDVLIMKAELNTEKNQWKYEVEFEHVRKFAKAANEIGLLGLKIY